MLQVVEFSEKRCSILDTIDNTIEDCDLQIYKALSELVHIEVNLNTKNKTEYKGVSAFEALRNLPDTSSFYIGDVLATKLCYTHQGLSTSGLKEVIRVQINNKIESLSLDYMRNSNLTIIL